MTDFTNINVESRGEIEVVTMNRPKVRNALNPEIANELCTYFSELAGRQDVRVVLLTGAGGAFCAGADIGSQAFASPGPGRPQRQMAIQTSYGNIIRAMRRCPQPIIGLLDGPACGAGFSLALACDVRIATPKARMNAAYFKVGLTGCDMGSGYLLPRLVGLSVASELLMTGRFIAAERAVAVGLVSEISEPDNLIDTGLALAKEMLLGSPMGLRMTKDSLNSLIDAQSLEAGLAIEDRQQTLLMETSDFREAVTAFQEKRAPRYSDT